MVKQPAVGRQPEGKGARVVHERESRQSSKDRQREGSTGSTAEDGGTCVSERCVCFITCRLQVSHIIRVIGSMEGTGQAVCHTRARWCEADQHDQPRNDQLRAVVLVYVLRKTCRRNEMRYADAPLAGSGGAGAVSRREYAGTSACAGKKGGRFGESAHEAWTSCAVSAIERRR